MKHHLLKDNYITLFVDLQNKKTIYVAEGKGNETVKDFARKLHKHNSNPEQIKQVSCDMSPAFIKGVRENLPCAEITVDKFHIIKLALLNKVFYENLC